MTKQTSNRHSPEVRERAVRMVLEHTASRRIYDAHARAFQRYIDACRALHGRPSMMLGASSHPAPMNDIITLRDSHHCQLPDRRPVIPSSMALSLEHLAERLLTPIVGDTASGYEGRKGVTSGPVSPWQSGPAFYTRVASRTGFEPVLPT